MGKAGLGSIILLLLVMAACRDETSLPGAPQSCENPFELRVLEQDLLALVGEPSCQDVSQCRAIAFGAKPCGGPWRYLIYSTATVDAAEVARRVSRYNDSNRRLNQECGWASDCSFAIEPRLECRERLCVPVE